MKCNPSSSAKAMIEAYISNLSSLAVQESLSMSLTVCTTNLKIFNSTKIRSVISNDGVTNNR